MNLNHPSPDENEINLRPAQLGDLEVIESLFVEAFAEEYGSRSVDIAAQIRRLRKWYGPLKVLSMFPNRFQHMFTVHVAEQGGEIKGAIQVSPFNHSRSTWRVDHVAVATHAQRQGIGGRLLRHCMKHFREARTWILEVNIHNRGALGLYRHTGFQPIAQITYWSLSPQILADLASHEPNIPHLTPVSDRDAKLICQLDNEAMPPLVRQVFDRRDEDFRSGPLGWALDLAKQNISSTERIQAYVYEPERKAAIGYFNLKLSRDGHQPHVAQLTVHPAYTELYPVLITQMARHTQAYPPQSLALASTDYQPEREEFLLKIGAQDIERTLLMSRSVWHKLREIRMIPDNLRLQSLLRSLQVNQPLPERIDCGVWDWEDVGRGDWWEIYRSLGSLADWQEERLWSRRANRHHWLTGDQ